MDILPDHLLLRILNGSGHVYDHEAKSMAHEILAYRQKIKDAQAKANPPPTGSKP